MRENFIQEAEAEEVFETLANETRLKILQALWQSDDQSLTFSDLRAAVGTPDSGHFNYHLDKLVGVFVTKVDGGYRLTQAGKHVNGAISSGIYTVDGTLDPIVLDHSCRQCSGARTLRYENEIVRIECESCPESWESPVPPAVLAASDRDEIPHVVSKYLQTKFYQIINGFCVYCTGQMKATVGPLKAMDVGPEAKEEIPEDRDTRPRDRPVVQYDCQRCGAVAGIALDHALLLTDPAVTCFFYENGINVRERPTWGFSGLDPDRTEIESTDPFRASATFQIAESMFTVVVDEKFSVIDYR